MPARGAASTTPDGQVLRVLLVEDSAADRELVQRALREPAPLGRPVELEIVGDVDEALAATAVKTFTVILTDYSLPRRTGLDLLRALRESDDPTPLVLMTGAGDESLAVAALQQGAADYVVKHLGFERELPIVIERVLERRTTELEFEHERQSAAQHAKRLTRQVEEGTLTLRRALQESEALRQVGRALAAARELKPALDFTTQTAAQLVRAQAAVVLIRADTEFVLVSVWGALKQAPGSKGPDLPALLAEGWEETLAVALREGDSEIGLLWAGRSRAQAFSSREVELLEALADVTALAITNVRAHEALKQARPGERPAARRETTPAPKAAPTPPPPAPARAAAPDAATVDTSRLEVPPFPAALGRLLVLAENDEASPDAVEEAVRLDPTLAARAVQLASAPALGRVRAASSLHEALMVIGMRGVRNLAFAQFSRRLVMRWGLADQFLWELSVATAVGTQLLVERRQPSIADDAYLCGLLHNVGAVALNNTYPERYERALKQAIAAELPIFEAERAEFGRDAGEVTEELVATWGLPPRVMGTLKHWRRSASDAGPIIAALRWARTAALRTSPVWQRLLGDRAEPPWITQELATVEPQLGLDAETLAEVGRTTATRCEVLRGVVA